MKLNRLIIVVLLLQSCASAMTQDVNELCRYYDSIKGAEIPNIISNRLAFTINISHDIEFQKLNKLINDAIEIGEKIGR